VNLPLVLLTEAFCFALGLGLAKLGPRLDLARRDRAIVAVGAASAIGAALSDGSPTGWTPSDVVLKAALGLLLVWLAGGLPRGLVLALAALATMAGYHTPGFFIGAAALGVAVAGMVPVRSEPLNGAIAVAGIVQAALRLELPIAEGGTALVAALLLGPIFALGVRRADAALARTLRRCALAFGLLAIASAGIVAGSVLTARSSLEEGVRMLDATSVVQSQGDDTEVSRQLTGAHRSFSAASSILGGWWNRPAEVVPVLSQHWRLLTAVATTGRELSDVGQRAIGAPAIENIQVLDGQIPLGQLRELQPLVDEAAQQLQNAEARLTRARSTWLLPPVSRRLDEELKRIVGAAKTATAASQALPHLPGLLGADGPRRYFLAVQTPAELRGSGGVIGNYGEIVADNGRLRLTRFGRLFDLKAQGIDKNSRVLMAPPDFVARYARFQPEREWLNVNLSPDFPTDAGVIAGLYPQSGGQPIDGVIAVDPFGLAALLKVIGPVQSPNWPEPLTDQNAARILLYDQYQRFNPDNLDERVDFLGDVAEEVWRRVTQGSTPGLREVLIALAPAANDKHILISSTHEPEQRMLEEVGIAGKMAPVDGDFLGVVTQNAGGNKLDAYLQRTVDYQVRVSPDTKKLTSTATITLRNNAPLEGLPAYVGNNLVADLPRGHNKVYLSVYSPWDATGGRIDGAPVQLESEQELGRKVYSTAVAMPPQQAVTVTIEFTGAYEDADQYRLSLFRQPTVAPDSVRVGLSVRSGWQMKGGGTTWSRELQMTTDVDIELDLERRF